MTSTQYHKFNPFNLALGDAQDSSVLTYDQVVNQLQAKVLVAGIDLPLTAFADLRSATLTPQVQVTFPFPFINSDIIALSGNGTAVVENSTLYVNSGAGSLNTINAHTRRELKYRAGLGSLARFTGIWETGGVTNSKQLIGLGDHDIGVGDGLFFGYIDTVFGIIVRKNGVDTMIPQASWSEDTMIDGTGQSGQILDKAKINVFQIQLQYLGAGEIKFFVECNNTGRFCLVHRIKYANLNTVPSQFNPTYHMKLEIQKTGAGVGTVIRVGSSSMAGFCEGTSLITGTVNSHNRTLAYTTGAERVLFHLRNKQTYAGVANTVSIFLRQFLVANETTRLAVVKIYRDCVLTGTPTWVDINTNNSVVDIDTVQTVTTYGKIINTISCAKDSATTLSYDGSAYDLRPENEVWTVTAVSDGAGDINATLTWVEDF
jgi:hypothetical protein